MTDLNGGLVVELEELGAEGQEQILSGVGDVLRCDEYPHTHRLKTATWCGCMWDVTDVLLRPTSKARTNYQTQTRGVHVLHSLPI